MRTNVELKHKDKYSYNMQQKRAKEGKNPSNPRLIDVQYKSCFKLVYIEQVTRLLGRLFQIFIADRKNEWRHESTLVFGCS